MAGAPLDMGKWKGLFEWSMKYQDGERPTEYGSVSEMSEEKRAWLEEAMRDHMKDIGERMKEIKAALDDGSAAAGAAEPAPASPAAAAAAAAAAQRAAPQLAREEVLLDELMEIVESVDYARDLSKVGGLDTLLALMACPYPSLRWRAAEVAATCMANNPPVQRWFMDGGAAPPLMALLGDGDGTCRAKALLALSALVRHYDPGLDAFLAAGGLGKLLAMLGAEDSSSGSGRSGAGQQGEEQQAGGEEEEEEEEEGDEEAREEAAAAQRRLRRKALALLQYVCAKRPAEGAAAARRGALPALRAVLSEGSGYGSEARVAALDALRDIAAGGADGWALVAADAPALAPALDALAAAHAALPREDREDEADEAEAIGRLRALLAARGPPPRAGAGAAFDHIEVDEWQDGGARHGGRSVPLAGAAQRGQQQQQQQQQQRHQRQQTDREDEADEAEAIGRLRALLAARGPPPRAGAGAAFDHIEVDEWQDGGARHGGRSVPLAGAAQRGQQHQQQQQQQHQRQQTVAAAAAKPALPLALAPPKP
ncbi:hypothetical protein Rsub_11697 [Raphidocelis subcapitata]|uniref:Nucleotide exchange factor Fes1 domain-containing protein n=1 Tax=Raphidocelis subcapitata TaxID=307507 RepID=A0A2V0PMA9_9CHLO|nr:hypothetical protein Rsub_11697 [Raphidocelis subcapitata]|eukprot:GBF98487.1 hypothetical protein Rsub_11697 [Raphidocelis subcapitata]